METTIMATEGMDITTIMKEAPRNFNTWEANMITVILMDMHTSMKRRMMTIHPRKKSMVMTTETSTSKLPTYMLFPT
jgi:hypothetical protein